MIVKHIAGFLDFKDVVNLHQTQKSIREDLKPLIHKMEVAMLKENGKLKQIVVYLAVALRNIEVASNDGNDLLEEVVELITDLVHQRFHFGALAHMPIYIVHDAFNIGRLRNPLPVDTLDDDEQVSKAIVQHFLNQMD